jgi:hypothetical protein
MGWSSIGNWEMEMGLAMGRGEERRGEMRAFQCWGRQSMNQRGQGLALLCESHVLQSGTLGGFLHEWTNEWDGKIHR